MRKTKVKLRASDRDPLPYRAKPHPYKAHPNPPTLSVERGRIKCFHCGTYEDSPLHYTIVKVRNG